MEKLPKLTNQISLNWSHLLLPLGVAVVRLRTHDLGHGLLAEAAVLAWVGLDVLEDAPDGLYPGEALLHGAPVEEPHQGTAQLGLPLAGATVQQDQQLRGGEVESGVVRLHLHHHQDSHPGLQLPPGHGGHLLGVALPAPHHAVPDAGLVAELRDGGERGLEAGDEDDLLTLPVGGVEDAVQGLAISQSLGQREREKI